MEEKIQSMTDRINQQEEIIHRLTSSNSGLRVMLRGYEWDEQTYTGQPRCSFCKTNIYDGHEEDCEWNIYFWNKSDPSWAQYESLHRLSQMRDSLFYIHNYSIDFLEEIKLISSDEAKEKIEKQIKFLKALEKRTWKRFYEGSDFLDVEEKNENT